MTGRLLQSLTAMAAVWVLGAGIASAQVPVMSQPAVSGNNVTFSWSATAGATAYRLEAGVASGAYVFPFVLGNVTSFQVGAPNGVFFVRVVALPGNEASNEVVVQVPAPPSAPTGLNVARNGTAIAATWTPGVGGGSVVGYRLIAALTSGGADFTIPTIAPGFGIGPVPPNTYFFRVVAYNAAGQSAPSNEVTVSMPVGGACDPAPVVPVSSFTFSGYLSISWPSIPGVVQYNLTASLNGAPLGVFALPGNQTQIAGVLPLGTYQVSVRAQMACGAVSPDNPVTIVNDGAPPPGPRAANPAPGQVLPLPGYGRDIINQLASERPDLVFSSCREFGGNNRFMFESVRRLRQRDTRWGLNWKRGNVGDVSQDIVSFNGSSLPDEGASSGPSASNRNIWIVDMIGGHCGARPGPNWEDVTGLTIERGARAVWTLLPYLQAGFTP